MTKPTWTCDSCGHSECSHVKGVPAAWISCSECPCDGYDMSLAQAEYEYDKAIPVCIPKGKIDDIVRRVTKND